MEYILIIDSGLGGLNQLSIIKKDFPKANIIYFADNKYCPYGDKEKDFLTKRSLKIITKLKNKYNICMLIFACNTLSTCAYFKIKKIYKKVFPTHPPIIHKKKSVLLCTPRTANSISKNNKYSKNKIVPLKDLASLIEKNFYNEEIENYIFKNIKNLNSFKHIILGCTHYTYIIDTIKKLNPKAKIYDSNFFTYKTYKPFLPKTGHGKLLILVSDYTISYKEKIKAILRNKRIFKFQIKDSHID